MSTSVWGYNYIHITNIYIYITNTYGMTLYRYRGLEADCMVVCLSMLSLKHLDNCQICQYVNVIGGLMLVMSRV